MHELIVNKQHDEGSGEGAALCPKMIKDHVRATIFEIYLKYT